MFVFRMAGSTNSYYTFLCVPGEHQYNTHSSRKEPKYFRSTFQASIFRNEEEGEKHKAVYYNQLINDGATHDQLRRVWNGEVFEVSESWTPANEYNNYMGFVHRSVNN